MEMVVLMNEVIESKQEHEFLPLTEEMLSLVGGGEGVVMTT